jgi:hypothetical protein
MFCLPVTVAARSKAWTVLARTLGSWARIVGSNPTGGMDVCLLLFWVYAGSGFAMGWSSVLGVLPTVLGLRNWSETKRFTDALCSKVGATGKWERAFWNIYNEQDLKLPRRLTTRSHLGRFAVLLWNAFPTFRIFSLLPTSGKMTSWIENVLGFL